MPEVKIETAVSAMDRTLWDVFNVFELFLGRPPRSLSEAVEVNRLAPIDIALKLIGSLEFRDAVLAHDAGNGRPSRRPDHAFDAKSSTELMAWAGVMLPILPETEAKGARARTWRRRLAIILADPLLRKIADKLNAAFVSETEVSELTSVPIAVGHERTEELGYGHNVNGYEDTSASPTSSAGAWTLPRLKPNDHLRAEPSEAGSRFEAWRALAYESHFQFSLAYEVPSFGCLNIEIELVAPPNINSSFYVDSGDGFNEEDRVYLPPAVDGVIRASIPSSREILRMRFDPTDRPGRFWLGCVRFRHIEAAQVDPVSIEPLGHAYAIRPFANVWSTSNSADAIVGGRGQSTRLVLTPLRDLTELAEEHLGWSAWRSHGPDPSFNVERPPAGFITGWTIIEIEIQAPPGTMSVIYVDEGDGYTERTRICFPVREGNIARALAYIPNRLKTLRFDPIDATGDFALGGVRFQHLSNFDAFLGISTAIAQKEGVESEKLLTLTRLVKSGAWEEANEIMAPEAATNKASGNADLLTSLLTAVDMPWSTLGLEWALRHRINVHTEDRSAEPEDRDADPLSQLYRRAHGIDICGMAGIEILRPGARKLRFSPEGPQIDLRLTLSAASSPYVQVDFGLTIEGGYEMGSLYLDYGEGFSLANRILLWPRGRPRFSAFVAATGLKALRWMPSDGAAIAKITALSARPISTADLRDRITERIDRFDLLDSLARKADNAASFRYELSRILTRDLGGHVGSGRSYSDWIRCHEWTGDMALRVWREELLKLPSKPLISVLVPTYETDDRFLREMIESVQAQIYPNWELCIADDASRQPHVRDILESYAQDDSRIKLAFRAINGHISAATTTALELATGEWSALLDHDDVLRPHALLAVAKMINLHPDVQLIYSDEDKLDRDGERTQPFFKPDYSPELLLAQNYFNHLTVHRTANIRAVGGWRVGLEGSQDYDLNLRVIEKIDATQIRHIPEVLYHWRIVAGSTSLATEEKSYASDAGLAAVREHLERTGKDAQVEMLPSRYYRVRHALPTPPPMVSLIIPTRDRADLLAMSVGSILEKSTYPNYEIIIVDNGSVEAETKSYFKKIKKNKRVKVLEYDQPFNYSAINNFAAAQCRGDIIGLVNNDIEVISPDWIEELVSWAVQDGVGCVGAKLYYPDDRIQHAGVVLGIGGVAGHSHKYYDRNNGGYFSRLSVHHTVSAVTGACLFVRKSLFEAVGGLEEALAVAFNDVDFCLRIRALGYRNVFTPFAELYHHESVSRGVDHTPEKAARFLTEIELMRFRWENELRSDPYYSPNLSLEKENYDLRWLDE